MLSKPLTFVERYSFGKYLSTADLLRQQEEFRRRAASGAFADEVKALLSAPAGRMTLLPPGRSREVYQKITSRIEINAETGCWNWTGPHSGYHGRGKLYPRMSLDGATVAVHRAMFILFNGPIPPKKQVDHKCRNRGCVNPEHLEMVTHKENQRRRDSK
jgi:hypothetical protein